MSGRKIEVMAMAYFEASLEHQPQNIKITTNRYRLVKILPVAS
jgi:hypothetical protein